MDDLLIFTRIRLGDALTVSFASQDIGRICSDAVDEVRASYSAVLIDLCLAGELQGWWDGSRIGQLTVNLLANAVGYGSGQIALEASRYDEQVTIVVSKKVIRYRCARFPRCSIALARANAPSRSDAAAGMGLGLYICRCVVAEHQGTVIVQSTESGTSFTVYFPCSPSG